MQTKETAQQEIMVSVCVVTYNHARYIGECLEHILSQERDFPIEILIHDDASQDGAQEIIRRYQERFPEMIRPILRTENQYSRGITNITGAFNIPRARGRYVAVMDGDDYWCDSRKLQKQVDYMETHPECVFSFHSARILTENGALVNAGLLRPFRESRRLTGPELVDKSTGAPFASFLLRRSILEPLPDYYRDCPVGDRPLELMAAAAGEAYYFDEAMSVYRFQVGGSWTEGQLEGDRRRKQDLFAEGMEKTYQEFDRVTGGRFHAEAVRAAARTRFLTRVNLRDFREIYRPEYRSFLRELGWRDRFFIRFEYCLPRLYRLLQRAHSRRRRG